MVHRRLSQFLPHEHARFVEHKPCALEKQARHVLKVRFFGTQRRQVVRRAAQAGVVHNALGRRHVRQHAGGIEIIERTQFHLRRPPSVQRAFLAQHLVFHEALVASAEHHHRLRFRKPAVDGNLQSRRQLWGRFRGVREFVEHDEQLFARRLLCQEFERVEPIRERRQRRRHPKKLVQSAREITQIVTFALLLRREHERTLAAGELFQKGRFPHTASPVQHDHLERRLPVAILKLRQFSFARDEHAHCLQHTSRNYTCYD